MESIGNVCIYSATKSKTLLTSKNQILEIQFKMAAVLVSKFSKMLFYFETGYINFRNLFWNLSDLSWKLDVKCRTSLKFGFCDQIRVLRFTLCFYSLCSWKCKKNCRRYRCNEAKNSLPGWLLINMILPADFEFSFGTKCLPKGSVGNDVFTSRQIYPTWGLSYGKSKRANWIPPPTLGVYKYEHTKRTSYLTLVSVVDIFSRNTE